MNSMLFLRSPRLVLACLALAGAGAALIAQNRDQPASPVVRIESGFTYSRGSYGLEADTEVFAVPTTLSYEPGRWAFRATVPWVNIKGPASVVGSAGSGAGGPARPTTASEFGVGDSVLSATFKANTGADRLNVELTGRLKLPTGDDDRGIGTGEIDEYAQVDFYRTLGGITPFATLGYRWLGDGRYQLADGGFASGGMAFHVAEGTSVGAAYEWRDAIVDGGDRAREASVFIFHQFTPKWNSQLYVLKGFTDASPEIGAGALLSCRF